MELRGAPDVSLQGKKLMYLWSWASVANQPQTCGRRATAALVSWLTSRWLDLAATALIVGGVALRLTLAALGWPATDSDEATFGLMARHISERGAHPIFFYGQNYMGAVEAYLAAGAF